MNVLDSWCCRVKQQVLKIHKLLINLMLVIQVSSGWTDISNMFTDRPKRQALGESDESSGLTGGTPDTTAAANTNKT